MATLDQMDQYLQIRPQCMHSILSLDLSFKSVTFKVSICFTKMYQFIWFWGVMFLLYVSTYMYNVRLKKYCLNNEKWSKTYMFGKKLNQERLYKNTLFKWFFCYEILIDPYKHACFWVVDVFGSDWKTTCIFTLIWFILYSMINIFP